MGNEGGPKLPATIWNTRYRLAVKQLQLFGVGIRGDVNRNLNGVGPDERDPHCFHIGFQAHEEGVAVHTSHAKYLITTYRKKGPEPA